MRTPGVAAFVIDAVRIEGLSQSQFSTLRDAMVRDAIGLAECHPSVTSIEVISATDRSDDAGARLRVAAVKAFAAGAHAILFLGAQTPSLPDDVLSLAIDALSVRMSAVIGQATGGAAYLIGLNDLFSDFFTEVKHDDLWRTGSDGIAGAIQVLSEAADQVSILPEWPSIVDVASLESFAALWEDGDSGSETLAVSRTFADVR